MTYITQDEIDLAASLGACEEAVTWLRTEPRTWDDVMPRYAGWLLMYAPLACLTPERLDVCAAAAPGIALQSVADRLTPERLDACAAAAPWAALKYAAVHLTPERLDACAAAAPWAALKYAAVHLTPERRAQCEAEVWDD